MLTGRLDTMGALRHTPAGVPALEFRVAHVSTQIEAGLPRRVSVSMPCLAMGTSASAVSRLALGSGLRLEGFLAQRTAASSQVILHVTGASPEAA